MTTDEDPFEKRKSLTFEQAEGVVSLPTQLKLKEMSQELRAVLWHVVYSNLEAARTYPPMGGASRFENPWRRILHDLHITRDHLMVDEFVEDATDQINAIKAIFVDGDYLQIFGWLQAVLHRNPPHKFAESVDNALRNARASYRVIDKKTIVPIGSEIELKSLKDAFADLAAIEFHGARAHLRNAGELLTAGKWADSIRESIHAVESVARVLDGSGDFSKALARLETSVKIHRAMKEGFKKLYGYTSDEKGIRHPMLDDSTSSVDEHDAIFMIGACAAFVSYLINKAIVAGLLKSDDG